MITLNRICKSVIFLLLLNLALIMMPGAGYAATANQLDYVALGDSLAAGQTPYRTWDKGYTDFIAARLADGNLLGSFKNYGVSGYTTSNVLMDITNPSNVELLDNLAKAEVITLDVGANDLFNALLNSDGTVNSDPEAVRNSIASAGYNIFAILAQLRDINPNAKIYVMGYYNAFPYKPAEVQGQMVQVIEGLNSVTQFVTELMGVTYVPTETAIAKNYEKYLPNPDDIHLSQSGYKTVAKEFWNQIKHDLPENDD